MAKGHGMGDQLWVGGYDLGTSTEQVAIAGGFSPIEMTDITQSAHARAGGERTGSMGVTSFFNPDAGASHAAYSPLLTTDMVATYAHTTAIGGASANHIGKQLNYDANRGQDGALLFAVDTQSNGYGLQWAFQATAGKRTDAAATAAAAVTAYDQGSPTPGAFGLVMWVQLFSLGSGTPTIKLQESSDNAGDPYTDVVGATTGALSSAPTSLRIQTGSIDVERYLKVVTTGTFTNAVFAVSVYRHRIATVY